MFKVTVTNEGSHEVKVKFAKASFVPDDEAGRRQIGFDEQVLAVGETATFEHEILDIFDLDPSKYAKGAADSSPVGDD